MYEYDVTCTRRYLRHRCVTGAVGVEEAEMAARLLRAAVRVSAVCRVSPVPVLSRGMAAGGERVKVYFISVVTAFNFYLSSI